MKQEIIENDVPGEIRIRFWGQNRRCPLCISHYNDDGMAMRFLDLSDQVNHIRAVHSFFLIPKSPDIQPVETEHEPTF